MTLSEELKWRGFVNQTTLKDVKELDTKEFSFYWGVDPSAPSMTIGNLAMAMMVRLFAKHGHKATLLVGGATGAIGDPDGKQQERDLKSFEEIAKNKEVIISQYRQIFDGIDFDLVDNYDWFKDLSYLSFLREVGKHLSMTQLLQRDFVQKRIGKGGSGISYAEFSYSLIQGYDFLHLYRSKGIEMQVAGADQWGNSICGVDLIRKLESKEAHVWTGPLVVNTATGKKFGKTEDGAVWLSSQMTSPFEFYQFWLNIDDAGVEGYLKIYTFLDKEAVDNLILKLKSNPSERAAQKALAFEVTKIVHGEDQAKLAKDATEKMFSGELNEATPVLELVEANEYSVFDLLLKSKLVDSRSQAIRLWQQGGIKINRQRLDEETIKVSSGDVLQVGKRNFVRLVIKKNGS